MATGGGEVDSRVICSLCLEPYGRLQAKILPCFHTFCLPCLSGLVTRKETSKTSGLPGLGVEEETKSACTVTCPNCRCIIPVPDGGVSAFQTNFYLNSSNREEDAPPVLCYLCDGDQRAQFHCGQCQNNFCSQCRRSHDKLCQGGQVTALPDPLDICSSSSSSTAQNPTQCQVRQQQQQVQDALKKLTEEEKKLNQEREAMDDSINIRYATLLGHAADARDACCLSLREVYDGLMERLRSQVAEARQTLDTLQQQLSSSQPASVSASQLRAALFMEGDLPMILNRDLDSSSLLQHHREDNTSLMTNTLQSFMGKITKATQISSGPAQGREPSGSTHFGEGSSAVSSLGSDPKSLNDLYEKFGDLAGRVTLLQSMNTQLTQLQSMNTQLTQQVMLLSNANSKLCMEQSTLQRQVTALKDRNVQLTTEQAGLQREVMAMRDKHAIVHQDLAVLTAEKDKMGSELGKVQKDVISLQTDSSIQQTDILQLKADHGDVVAKLSNVQTDITALQGEDAGMKKDVDQLKTDCSELKSDLAKIQGKLSDLETGHRTLQADMTESRSQVSCLEQKVQSAEKLEQDNRKALTRLEEANTQAAFHACLSDDTTVTKKQTLICDHVLSNVGGCYSNKTGVFTAPLAGTYSFLVTTSPCRAEKNKKARLDIVLDDDMKGYVHSQGNNWSTGHTVVKMTTGQKVWLRTYDDREYFFSGGWWTTFIGFLIQANV